MPDSNGFIAIGDVHGCPQSLKALLGKLDEEELSARKIVFVGDYIDRGPDSKGVVDFLLGFRREHDCVFIRGNHEQMMLDAVDQGNMGPWMMNGAGDTLRSYGISRELKELPDSHMAFYRDTKLYYETEEYFFVHAGLSPGITIRQALEKESTIRQFLWERSHLAAPETAWEKTVVFGHTPKHEPVVRDRMIGIDTGCVYGSMGYGILTAALLPEVEFVQQACLD